MNRVVLRVLDIFIIIAFFGLLYILIEPQYQNAKVITKERKLQSNMFTIKAAIERYRAFNKGEIPFLLSKIYEQVESLKVPVNPYTESKMELHEVNRFLYDVPSQIESTDTNGYHADKKGNPGEIMIGFFMPFTSKDTIPRSYGIIGFNAEGKPLTIEEGEKVRIVVLEE
jgi:Tfp pilus assembly protein PilE